MSDNNTSYTITLIPARPDPGPDDPNYDSKVFLDLEQLDLNGEAAYETCMGDCRKVSSESLYNGPDPFYEYCIVPCLDFCEDTQKIDIKVTKFPNNLNYNLVASYGILGPQRTETDNYAESHDINLKSSLTIPNNLGAASLAWEGDIWDQTGNIIAAPLIVFDEATRTASWGGQLVVGTIRVTAMETYDVWSLNIPPREDSLSSSAWSSTVRAFYINGSTPQVETLEVQEKNDSGLCGTTGHDQSVLILNPDRPDDPDEEKCIRHVEVRDPCTGELISERDEPIECPQKAEDEDEDEET